jgi:hypothetical protein
MNPKIGVKSRGACASGVWFSASRRKLRLTNISPAGFPRSLWNKNSGVTPEFSRGTRKLPMTWKSGRLYRPSSSRTL